MRKRAKFGEPLRFIREVAIPYKGDDCLVWPFSQNGHGYGFVRVGKQRLSANRVVCELVRGEPPERSYVAAHECGNRICVNPRHITWKTLKENAADRLVHGTHDRGQRSANAKLTDDQARDILHRKGKEPTRGIAREFGISEATVYSIQAGRNWAWLHTREGAQQ